MKRRQPTLSQLLRAALPGYVYFVQPRHGGPIKIGWSWDPVARLPELERAFGVELRLLWAVRGTMDDERALHRRFAQLRISPDAEWFEAAPELVRLVRPRIVERQARRRVVRFASTS